MSRARYADVLLSGFFTGIGGSTLSLDLGQFVDNNQMMVNGEGFIVIVTFPFGNYSPAGAFGVSPFFAGLEAVQIRPRQVPGYGVLNSLIQTIPYVTVPVVFALVGHIRIPAASGEYYDIGDDNC